VLASHDEREVYHKKMTAINEIFLPVLLFVVYFFIAIQFLPQPITVVRQQANPVVAIETEAPATTLEEVVDCSQLSIVILQGRGYFDDAQYKSAKVNSDAVISRDWLETQSLANLKAIAAELCITPIGDKRSKLTWINAIASTTPENTVLALNFCYA
jgi:hypothetical protein